MLLLLLLLLLTSLRSGGFACGWAAAITVTVTINY